MSLDSLIENSTVIHMITEEVNTTDGFNVFCTLLGLPTSDFMKLKKKDDNVYWAIKQWTKQIHTKDEFMAIVRRFSENLFFKIFNYQNGTNYRNDRSIDYQLNDEVSKLSNKRKKDDVDATAPKGKFGSIASAMLKKDQKRVISCKDFFTAENGVNANSANELITHLDKSKEWEIILANMGILDGDEVAAQVEQLKDNWEKDEISPTRLIIKEFIEIPTWANSPMREFANELLSNERYSQETKQIIQKWIDKIDGKEKKSIEVGIERYTVAQTLNAFFISLIDGKGTFTQSDVNELVAKLQNDKITTTDLLCEISDQEFKDDYQLKKGQVIALRKAINQMIATQKEVPPAPGSPPSTTSTTTTTSSILK